jgi:hypothetical protein
MSAKTIVVEEIEDAALIAAEHGIADWESVYEAKENEELRKLRPNPHLLQKGDKLVIPDVAPKPLPLETGKVNRFVLQRPKLPLQLWLRDDDGRPYAKVKYEVWVNGARLGTGEERTREDGLVFKMVPLVRELELRVWYPQPKPAPDKDDDEIEQGDPEESGVSPWDESDAEPLKPEELVEGEPEIVTIQLGELGFALSVDGVLERLRNLGYDCGEDEGPEEDGTTAAIRQFQSDHGLQPSGKIDWKKPDQDPTLVKLNAIFAEQPAKK